MRRPWGLVNLGEEVEVAKWVLDGVKQTSEEHSVHFNQVGFPVGFFRWWSREESFQECLNN